MSLHPNYPIGAVPICASVQKSHEYYTYIIFSNHNRDSLVKITSLGLVNAPTGASYKMDIYLESDGEFNSIRPSKFLIQTPILKEFERFDILEKIGIPEGNGSYYIIVPAGCRLAANVICSETDPYDPYKYTHAEITGFGYIFDSEQVELTDDFLQYFIPFIEPTNRELDITNDIYYTWPTFRRLEGNPNSWHLGQWEIFTGAFDLPAYKGGKLAEYGAGLIRKDFTPSEKTGELSIDFKLDPDTTGWTVPFETYPPDNIDFTVYGFSKYDHEYDTYLDPALLGQASTTVPRLSTSPVNVTFNIGVPPSVKNIVVFYKSNPRTLWAGDPDEDVTLFFNRGCTITGMEYTEHPGAAISITFFALRLGEYEEKPYKEILIDGISYFTDISGVLTTYLRPGAHTYLWYPDDVTPDQFVVTVADPPVDQTFNHYFPPL